ncbi:methyl-accepting chemotaxis protein [Sediminicoccus sp. BL-A-41-H5]|uniref:methyl-accepting chemotaxis protein n=1 Tax=Sediminicoccus sp. BL-A-41-H5 TaxID=3421106 RepID=UPI003D672984
MHRFRHPSVTLRALLVLGAMCLGILFTAVNQSREVGRLNEAYRVIAEERSPGYVALARAQRHFQIVGRHLNRMAIEAQNPAALNALWGEVEAEIRNFHTRNDQFLRGNPDRQDVAQANRARHAELERAAVAVRDALQAGNRTRAEEIIRTQVDPAINALRDALVTQVDGNVGLQAAQAAAAREAAEAAIQQMWFALGGTVLLAAGVIFLLFRRGVALPLDRLTGTAEQLAVGESTGAEAAAALGGRQDEVGRLARAVTALAERAAAARAEEAANQAAMTEREATQRAAALQAMAQRVEDETRSAIETMTSRMRAVSDGSSRLSEGSARVTAESEGVASAAGTALEATQAVAAATEELSASIRSVTGQLQAASEASRAAVSGVEEGVTTIGGLQEAVGRIGEVARLIGEIAGQTNLLALNATIEAARAGDAGKGFAVVAGEVKALANLTAQRTGEIAQQIGAIETVTHEAVAAVRRIAEKVTQLDRTSGSMADAMLQQSSATEEIARSVAGAAASVRDVEARIATVAAEARRAREQASVMDAATDEARTGVAEMQQSLVRIVRTATKEVERRRAERQPARGSLQLRVAHAAAAAFELVNVSGEGFAVRGSAPAGAAITGEIGGETIHGRVVHAGDGTIRVQLLEPAAGAREALLAMARPRAA